jgi:hypothetical protein
MHGHVKEKKKDIVGVCLVNEPNNMSVLIQFVTVCAAVALVRVLACM